MIMLDKYPKKRSKLPLEYQRIYDEHYLSNREGKGKTTSLSKKLESWMHKKVASDVSGYSETPKTLEIGAGNLNHLDYEPVSRLYDVIEPYDELLNTALEVKTQIGNIYSDISEIDNLKRYDRIISIACFEHVLDLPFLVARSAKLLKDYGQLRIAIPNEGTFLWKWGTMVTGFEFKKKYGLEYDVLMKHEHVNSAQEIDATLNFFFKNVTCDVFGIHKKIGLYRFYVCKTPNLEHIEMYLKQNKECP